MQHPGKYTSCTTDLFNWQTFDHQLQLCLLVSTKTLQCDYKVLTWAGKAEGISKTKLPAFFYINMVLFSPQCFCIIVYYRFER